jgi:hypothetical protein
MLEEGRSSIVAELVDRVKDHFRTTGHIASVGVCFLGIRGIFYILPISLEAAKFELNVNFCMF